MKQPPCRCGYLSFPHRHSHWCDAWLAQQEDDDAVYEWDDCDAFHAKTDGMGEAEYSWYMGRGE